MECFRIYFSRMDQPRPLWSSIWCSPCARTHWHSGGVCSLGHPQYRRNIPKAWSKVSRGQYCQVCSSYAERSLLSGYEHWSQPFYLSEGLLFQCSTSAQRNAKVWDPGCVDSSRLHTGPNASSHQASLLLWQASPASQLISVPGFAGASRPTSLATTAN